MTTHHNNYDPFDPLASFGPRVLSRLQLRLIYWGSAWNTGVQPELRATIETKLNVLLKSGYLDGLAQYNKGARIEIEPVNAYADVDAKYDPPKDFADPADPGNPAGASHVIDEITRLLKEHEIGLPVDTSVALLCMVIMPPGVTCSSITEDGEPPVGQHFYFDYGGEKRRVYYGWVLNASADKITAILSEELVEAITDPEPPTGWVVRDNIGVNRELCDVCEAVTHYVTVDGKAERVLVKAYYSLKDRDAIQFETAGGAR